MDKCGRKIAIYNAAVCAIVGGALLCGAVDVAMFLVGRFISGLGAWSFFTIVPVYATELASAHNRGWLVGVDAVMLTAGYSVATYMGLAFFSITGSSVQWRGPLGIAILWPVIMLMITLAVPESPRWLLMQQKDETARQIIYDIHSSKTDPDGRYPRTEFYQMQTQIATDRRLSCSWVSSSR